MEVLGSFASGIAHNFNNIVGAILGYAEIAESQLTTNRQASATLDEIRTAGERARDLVDEILTFGRRRDGHREEVNLRDLMTEVVSLLRASLPGSIDLAVSEAPAETYVVGVPAQLQQLIINLCNNAAQAMDGSGRVEIDLCVHEALQPQVLTHGELTQGRYVCISVSDSGYGMEEAVLDRLFEPFFTTRQNGNGLGLATVHEIVRELGGAMNVLSVPGAGSRFEAWLPCTDAVSAASAENEPFYPFGLGQTLLLIGYGQAGISADEEILAALGYEPVGFTRIAEAVEACRTMPDRFDAVVLGQFVSVRTALDLAGVLHELRPDLPILLTTPSIHQVDIGSLVIAGISEIVQRPIISAELAAALKRCLQDGAAYGRLAS
jgi:CheY-like chemotaxis protein